MPDSLLECGRVNQSSDVRIPKKRDLAVAAFGSDCRDQDWAQRLSFDPLNSSRRTRSKAREELVHLAYGRLQRRNHIGAELGIVGMALGVAGDQRELTDQVLDV